MQEDIFFRIQEILSFSRRNSPNSVNTRAPGPGGFWSEPVSGGSINDTYHVWARDGREWFCKVNDAGRFPGLFEKEMEGLDLLRSAGVFRVPAVIACETIGPRQFLLLEWIGQSPVAGTLADEPGTSNGPQASAGTVHFWTRFGEQLARLHQVRGAAFGLERDNYMGALPQYNGFAPNWAGFFLTCRLEPQVRLATDQGLLGVAERQHFVNLYRKLDEIFPESSPSLLHGDLWSGNFLRDEQGQPVLIDPAVYYGDRSMDLAMTTLFGGFEKGFYEAYHYHYPLPRHYREQWEICNLYPLLTFAPATGRDSVVIFASLDNT